MTGVFVTGTDTGVGKTHFACALIRQLRARGLLPDHLQRIRFPTTRHAQRMRVLDLEHIAKRRNAIPEAPVDRALRCPQPADRIPALLRIVSAVRTGGGVCYRDA